MVQRLPHHIATARHCHLHQRTHSSCPHDITALLHSLATTCLCHSCSHCAQSCCWAVRQIQGCISSLHCQLSSNSSRGSFMKNLHQQRHQLVEALLLLLPSSWAVMM